MDKKFTMSESEKILLEVTREIGGIYDANCHYSAGLARRLENTGKAISDMTVNELIGHIQAHTAYYNTLPV